MSNLANASLQAILTRRSIRSYRSDPVPAADLKKIVEAAILAPSARNQQKWHFTVITAKDVLDSVAAGIKEGLLALGVDFMVARARTPGYSPIHDAPALIVVSADANAPWIQVDCGMAAENICLAAEALGLGSCVMAMPGLLFSTEKGAQWAKELGFPEGYTHVISVAVGYRKGEAPAVPARNLDVVNYVR